MSSTKQKTTIIWLSMSAPGIWRWDTLNVPETHGFLFKVIYQGSNLGYLVTNESQDTVRFPPTLNLRLYSFDESSGNWNVVQDSFKVSGNDIVLNPKGQEFWDLVNSVHPVLEPSSKPVKIRIIVVGEVEGNDKKPVGAYLDVILKPEGVNAQFYLLHETEIYAEKTVIPHVVRLIGSAS